MRNKKIIILLFSNNDAGLPDLKRFKKKYKKAIIINNHNKNLFIKIKNLILLYRYSCNIFIHSQIEKWGLIIKFLIPGSHYQVVHVQSNFKYSKNLFLIHRIIHSLNRILSKKNIFLSSNVFDSYNKRGKLINFRNFLIKNYEEKKNIRLNHCFFFGRDQKYKNLDFIIKLSSMLPDINFLIYSNNYEFRNNEPKNFIVINERINDQEINEIYNNNGLLLLPYLEVAQSGPFYIAIENNTQCLVSDLEYFQDFNNESNVNVLKLNINLWIEYINKKLDR